MNSEMTPTETWQEADKRLLRLNDQITAFMRPLLLSGPKRQAMIALVATMVQLDDFTVHENAPEIPRKVDVLVSANTFSDKERRVVYTRILRLMCDREIHDATVALVKHRTGAKKK